MPYICVDLNLDEQLIHLSTAAHMAFYFYTDNGAKTSFMPNQSYVDLMIMIKNVYFCIAKFKKDNPDGKFFIILLGTNCLKGFFGLIRTAVGTDCNVDIFQLGSRASGLTEVAVILALHPEWDRSPRRLTLQAVTREMDEFTYKVDHINPASWHGNVHVKDVNLHSCWLIGHQKAVESIPKAQSIFESAEAKYDVNFLSPFSSILMNKQDNEDGSYNCSELQAEYPADNDNDDPKDLTRLVLPSISASKSNATLEGNLEDAISVKSPCGPISLEVLINGKFVSKPAELHRWLLHRLNHASTDCLRRVQEVSCFNSSAPVLPPGRDNLISDSD